MLFLTYWFVLFLAVTLPVYWLVRTPRLRLAWLLLCSIVFHGHFAGPAGVLPILVLALLTYAAGLSRNRLACLAGILASIAALAFYKYLHFLCQQLLGTIWPAAAAFAAVRVEPLCPTLPPLAISFFVFEFVHYLYDVRSGHEPISNPWDFALFSLYWPSIVAGPVKRYEQFVPALHQGLRNVGAPDVAAGMTQLAIGLVKKFAADNLTAYLAVAVTEYTYRPLAIRWLFLGCLGLRILLDFSGYSDMAIGLARMMGVRLPANFNWPYLATDLADFWRRWHISLSSWIRDYVYIPLGGSRHGMVRKTANGLLAFALCGLWHGAAWNFLIWGIYHGVGLAACSAYRALVGPPAASPPAGPRGLVWGRTRAAAGWALTLVYVQVGWLLFFYPVPQAWSMFRLLFGGRG